MSINHLHNLNLEVHTPHISRMHSDTSFENKHLATMLSHSVLAHDYR